MARVTVEDCVDKVENRFELVLLASHRARMISSGSQLLVERDRDKNPVVALREIAAGEITRDYLHVPVKQDRFTLARPPLPTPTPDLDDEDFD